MRRSDRTAWGNEIFRVVPRQELKEGKRPVGGKRPQSQAIIRAVRYGASSIKVRAGGSFSKMRLGLPVSKTEGEAAHGADERGRSASVTTVLTV